MENIHDFVVGELSRRDRAEWRTIAGATNVPFQTIVNVARGITTSPRYSTLQPLAAYFAKAKAS